MIGLAIPSTDANKVDTESSTSQVINLNMQDVMGKLRRMKRTTTKRWFYLLSQNNIPLIAFYTAFLPLFRHFRFSSIIFTSIPDSLYLYFFHF